MSTTPDYKHRRPWSLRIFCLITAGIGAYNLLLAWDHVHRAGYYRDLGVSYPPLGRAAWALVWGVLLLGLDAGLWRRQRWARRWILIALSNYGVFGVLWLSVYARSDFGRGRIGFQAALTALLVILAWWFMHWRRIRAVFERTADTSAGSDASPVERSETVLEKQPYEQQRSQDRTA
jgi:hypothetical protein